jgi:FKBP-type peptidyl-prolyl cis-trans isomerase FklB
MKINCFACFSFFLIWNIGSLSGQDTRRSELKNLSDSVSYGVGSDLAKNIFNSGFDAIDLELVLQGMKDVYDRKESRIKPDVIQKCINTYLEDIKTTKKKVNAEKGAKFLEENGSKPGVVKLPSGMQYMVVKEGNGPKPKESDHVEVHYSATLLNGKVFEDTRSRNFSAKVPVNGVMKGWTEGLQLMSVGSIYKFFIPSELAFGEKGAGDDVGPNETLIFEIELIQITTKK